MIQLIGDLAHDTYHEVDCSRVNPEAPTLIMKHIGTKRTSQGMAGNVCNNLNNLKFNIVNSYYTSLSVKNRFIDKRNQQQIIRYDLDNCRYQESGILEDNPDLLLISDYCKNYNNLWNALGSLENNKEIPLIVNSKNPHISDDLIMLKNKNLYPRILIVNELESRKLQSEYNIDYKIITRGERGISLHWVASSTLLDDNYFHDPARKVHAHCVSGAGDTVTATIAWYIHEKGFTLDNLKSAVRLANIAASISVSHFGTYAVSYKELEEKCKQLNLEEIL
jgi:bifunctional ADP-heptose synthase (sugar kinase/adenylyltransferase)